MKLVRDRGVRRHRAALRRAVSMSAAVCEVLSKEIGYPREQVTHASLLRDELRLDFFDLAELVEALESTSEGGCLISPRAESTEARFDAA